MPNQKIVWTAVPQGVVAPGPPRKLGLFVHVSPQLTAGATLNLFPDFLDWPALLAQATIRVTITGAPPVTVKPTVAAQASGLWKALFKATTPVEPYVYKDLSDRFIVSYPASALYKTIQNVYLATALASPEEYLPSAGLEQALDGLLGRDPDRPLRGPKREQIPQPDPAKNKIEIMKRNGLANKLNAAPPVLSGLNAAQSALLQTRAFHTARPVSQVLDPKTKTPVTALKPMPTLAQLVQDMDFHQIIAHIGEYPFLMRQLGLAIPLTIDRATPIPAGATVMVEVGWSPGVVKIPITPVNPRTVLSAKNDFLAQPQPGSDLQGGFLQLSPEKYDLIPVDIDGAALKLMQQHEGLALARVRKSADTPTKSPIAALRSAGLSLVRTARGQKLSAHLFRSKQHQVNLATNNVTVYADDLVRGYRVDIRTVGQGGAAGPWRSLCQRVGQYQVQGFAPFSATDEGYSEMGVTEQEGHPELYLHESLFRWNGWSLCAPRPGKPMPDGAPAGGAPFGVNTSFDAAPGTLPLLRFGQTYQMRVRVADLCGEGPKPTDKTEAPSSPEFFARYDPVAPPNVYLRVEPGAGESVERITVRSFNDTPAKDAAKTPEISERHVAPPRTTVEMAELHGKLDDAQGKPRPELYPVIIARNGDAADFAGKTKMVPNILDPTRPPQEYLILPETQMQVPYLPDPFSMGAALRGLPAGPGNPNITRIPFGQPVGWPDPTPFRIRLVEGPKGFSFSSAEHVLTVSLPKAEKARVRLSSLFGARELAQMGVWRWLETGLSANPANKPKLDALRQTALTGAHWMLTPYRELVFVHAVQQPLLIPTFASLTPLRQLGGTTAYHKGILNCDGKSTGRIDVGCEWEEPRDDPSDPTNDPTQKVRGSAHAFELSLRFPNDDVPETQPTPILNARKRIIAVYNPPVKQIDFETLPQQSPALVRTRDYPTQKFPDTKYRRVRYTPVATTRFREYFLPAVTSDPDNITRKPDTPVVVDVLNTARPDAPRPLYVIPTFGWERNATQSARRGGGLRVYLERPWFSSGDGEALGVLLMEGATNANDPRLHLITRWGTDPIWSGTPVGAFPTMGSFPKRLPYATMPDPEAGPGYRMKPNQFDMTGLFLEEANVPVAVAPHAVEYDPERDLWYSDIEVNAGGAYYPFIRLALARYQPRSLSGAHLSRVVLADFAQLVPNRALSMVRGGNNLNITLVGPAPANISRVQHLEVLVSVEGQPAGGTDMDWRDVVAPVPLAIAPGSTTSATRWTGTLTLPTPAPQPNMRLVVKEYEVFRSSASPRTPGEPRLVYAETLPL